MPIPPEDPGRRRPEPRRRRVDPDAYPFNQLPVVVYHDGVVHVARGEFDVAQLHTDHLAQLADYPGVAHVVFTNRIGQHHLVKRGWALAIGVDLTKAGWLPAGRNVAVREGATLAEHAADVRAAALRMLEIADQLQEMAADGWELVHDGYQENWFWPLRDTAPGPDYSVRPRRRRP